MSIGNNIRNIRKEKGMTLQQIATIMGCSPQLISQYESGKRVPKLETIQKIANALNVPLIQIMEHISLEQYKTTEEYKKTLIVVSAYEGILAILKHIYGSLEEKTVSSDYGESIYYLVGTGKDSFILYEGNIDKLLNYAVTSFPLIIDEMKDTRSEQEIIDDIKADLNSPEWIAEVEKYISEQRKSPTEE